MNDYCVNFIKIYLHFVEEFLSLSYVDRDNKIIIIFINNFFKIGSCQSVIFLFVLLAIVSLSNCCIRNIYKIAKA